MIHISKKNYLALGLLSSTALVAMDSGVAVMTQPAVKEQAQNTVSFEELLRIEKAFHLQKRAEIEVTRKISGPADIAPDEIEMMQKEAPELARLRAAWKYAFVTPGSDFEGWLIRAFDRENRYANWKRNQDAEKGVGTQNTAQ